MTLDMTLSGDFAALDPLQPVDRYDRCSLRLERTNELKKEGSTSKVENTTAILQWTVEQVATWLEESVPLGQDRMQECLRSFQAKGVDGLSLLTLSRSHQACTGMSDFEWLLLKAARKRSLSGGGKLDPLSVEKLGTKCNLSTSFWTPPCTPRKGESELTPPASPQSYRETSNSITGLRRAQGAFTFPSHGRMFAFPKMPWCSDAAKDDQVGLQC